MELLQHPESSQDQKGPVTINTTTATLAQKLKVWLFGPASRFRVGDSVQLVSGGPLMVVYRIFSARDLKEPLVFCRWYDPKTRENRNMCFPEANLKLFDWYNPE